MVLCELVLAGCGEVATTADASTTCGEAPCGSTGDSTGESTGSSTGEAVPTGSSGAEASSTGEGTTGEEGCPPGWADDLLLGPEPVMIDGGLAVPIDIIGLAGQFTIDVAGETTVVAAQLTFRVGAAAGRPVFDLRQELTAGDLDGEAIAPGDLLTRDLGGGAGAEMRVLDRSVEACSEHVLAVSYTLVRPPGFAADPPAFEEDGVSWDLSFNDVAPRMYLEQWLPANLIHDRHPIAITLEIVGGLADQRVISNGALTAVGDGKWEIEYPVSASAMSPMLVLAPGNEVTSLAGMVGGVEVEVHRSATIAEDPAELLAIVTGAFAEYVDSTGEYLYPRFTAYVNKNAGMEYDGGATSAVVALPHELFHSWFGRGVVPQRGSDGWFDEAWTEYSTGEPTFPATPMDLDDPPVTLCDGDTWSRTTSLAAYNVGRAVFAGIAAEVGVDALRSSMREFYVANAGERVTTEALERHLHCGLQGPVRALFHRYVYGRKDAPEAVPDGYCR
jgi:hypothetical protein